MLFFLSEWMTLPCRQGSKLISSLNDSKCDRLEPLQGVVDGKQRLCWHEVLDIVVDSLEVVTGPKFQFTGSKE